MTHEAFTLGGNLPTSGFQLLIFQHNGTANIAKFRMGKLNVSVVDQTAIGRLDEMAQTDQGTPEMV